MFFNMQQRQKMFKSPSDEFNRIMDVVSKYSIHNAKVSFTLTKQGEKVSLRTPANSTQRENIRNIYGTDVAQVLESVECESEPLQFKMSALTTNVKYSSKKFTFLLFINHRLVESTGVFRFFIHSIFLFFNYFNDLFNNSRIPLIFQP